MGVPNLSFYLLWGIISTTIGSDQEGVESLKKEVLELRDSISSIPMAIRAENEEMLLHISDKMADNLETLRKECLVLRSNHSMRVEQLANDIAQTYQNLGNQTFAIEKLSQQLEAFRSFWTCAGEPPSPQNGRPVDFERKHGSEVRYGCDKNFVQTENSTIRCHFGKWEGQPPVCSLPPTCTGEPPSPRNGRPMDFERKHGSDVRYRCDRNWVVSGNSTVRCRFGKWEGRPPLCTRLSSLDATYTLRVPKNFQGSEEYRVTSVGCSSGENYQKMDFSRILDTGTGGALPTGAKTYNRGREAILDLAVVSYDQRVGIYECWHETDGKRKTISFVIQRGGWFQRPEVASVGDTVKLGVFFDDPSYRWLHHGEHVPAWDGRGAVQIVGVRREDAGFYEFYKEGDRRDRQWFYKVVVRGCPANFFGDSCDQSCTPCLNGGVCHDRLGTCVCPPGFQGQQCEVACGENRFGSNCSISCARNCRWQTFCKPDPFGCSCAPGYWGNDCQYVRCPEGKFGADCLEVCHCKEGTCNQYTGACSAGCSIGWTGPSCQIQAGH